MAPSGIRIGLFSGHHQPTKHPLLLNNSFSNLEPWLFQKLKLFYFCGAYMYPCDTDPSATVLSHPGNRDLFYDTVWSPPNNFPPKPMIRFLVLFLSNRSAPRGSVYKRSGQGCACIPVKLRDENQKEGKWCGDLEICSQITSLQMFGTWAWDWLDWWDHTDVNNR